jgi:RNA polymerase sigma-70 factor (ECF subfamily)
MADATILVELQELRGQQLFGFARRLGLSDEAAADAVQETLVRLWRELRRGVLIDEPAGWAFRTLYRVAMDEHRWRRRAGAIFDRLAAVRPASAGSAESDDRLTVWAEVDRLPPRQRHVLYLRFRADLPFEQVATVLGITPGAARTHSSRGLKRLRARLSPEEMR